jgi:mono/diheme cytochrome c family protein
MNVRLPVLLAAVFAASIGAVAAATSSPVDNGRAMFQVGRDLAGNPIRAASKPLRASCAGCHRANGSGGLKLPGRVISADLRHAALVTHQQPPYTQALLERAISTGIDNKGEKLDPVMPRWRLSKTDLHDVAQYVLTQLK